MRSQRKLSGMAALMAAVLALTAPAIASASSSAASRNSGHVQPAAAAGTALPLPLKPAPSGDLASLSGGTARSPVEPAGAVAARRSGKPVTVAALTSQTTMVTADPGGGSR